MNQLVFGVSDFVAVFNQTVSYAYPDVTIEGELANFTISKNRWVYFNLKDELASVKFFGSVQQLAGPLEEGMKLRVSGQPQLHPQYGFSITVRSIQLAGEGTIKKAAKLLEAKLEKEGLFAEERKRPLPHPPRKVGLIASGESAAYSDFLKVINARWGNIEIDHYDVQVQGDDAPGQLVRAVEFFARLADAPDVLVLTRGGGSVDDLQAFSDERVTRAVAGSRVPTLVAVGHERDVSLAERAADVRASTPSNAAELLVPDFRHEREVLKSYQREAKKTLSEKVEDAGTLLIESRESLQQQVQEVLRSATDQLASAKQVLELTNPRKILQRGYAIVRQEGKVIRNKKQHKANKATELEFYDGRVKINEDNGR